MYDVTGRILAVKHESLKTRYTSVVLDRLHCIAANGVDWTGQKLLHCV